MSVELVKLNKARQALIEAKSLDEILKIRDTSVALEAWCQAAKLGIKMQNECAEIKIRAEIKAGEFLKQKEKHKGGRPAKSNRLHDATTLKELGIEKNAIPPLAKKTNLVLRYK